MEKKQTDYFENFWEKLKRKVADVLSIRIPPPRDQDHQQLSTLLNQTVNTIPRIDIKTVIDPEKVKFNSTYHNDHVSVGPAPDGGHEIFIDLPDSKYGR